MLQVLTGAICVFVGVLLGSWLQYRQNTRQSPLPLIFNRKISVTGGEETAHKPQRKL